MLCEVCGRESQQLRTVLIEGSELNVCPECARFGVERSPKPKKSNIPLHVAEALEKREKRSQPRDIFQEPMEELVADYSQRIRRARERLGWTPEELGKRAKEKKSVILKLEAGEMRPDDALARKLERVLGIKLRERPTSVAPPPPGPRRGLTLGDLIKIKKNG
ncbi:MAG: multiprotein bridging factor aMBF1 [Thermoplasmata archaeon]